MNGTRFELDPQAAQEAEIVRRLTMLYPQRPPSPEQTIRSADPTLPGGQIWSPRELEMKIFQDALARGEALDAPIPGANPEVPTPRNAIVGALMAMAPTASLLGRTAGGGSEPVRPESRPKPKDAFMDSFLSTSSTDALKRTLSRLERMNRDHVDIPKIKSELNRRGGGSEPVRPASRPKPVEPYRIDSEGIPIYKSNVSKRDINAFNTAKRLRNIDVKNDIYDVTGVSAAEYAKADKNPNYSPKETVIARIEAPSETYALKALDSIRTSLGDRSLQLARSSPTLAGPADNIIDIQPMRKLLGE